MSHGLIRDVCSSWCLRRLLVQTVLMMRMTVFILLYLLEHIICKEAVGGIVSLYICR